MKYEICHCDVCGHDIDATIHGYNSISLVAYDDVVQFDEVCMSCIDAVRSVLKFRGGVKIDDKFDKLDAIKSKRDLAVFPFEIEKRC